MPFRPAFSVMLLIGTLACGQTPVLEGTSDDEAFNAPYPALLPLSALQGAGPDANRITTESIATIGARLASLRARAARLNGPVVDPATRTQMRAAIARAALR